MAVTFEKELKDKLESYGQILTKIDDLIAMKDQIRGQLKQWMAVNNLTEHCIYDENNQCWKLGFNTSSRRSVIDWNELRILLGSDYTQHVQMKDCVSFIVKKVKKPV